MTPPNDETATTTPPDTAHLQITQEDRTACFRPWTAPLPHDQDANTDPQPQDPAPETQATDEADPLDPLFTDDLLHTMLHAIPSPETDTAEHKFRRKAAAMVLLRALDAQEPVEAAIAAHAVLAHHAALASFRRAAQPNQSPAFADRQSGTAAILSGAFCRLLHALEWRQNQTPLPVSQDEPRWRR
jgi:hypothetical protein